MKDRDLVLDCPENKCLLVLLTFLAKVMIADVSTLWKVRSADTNDCSRAMQVFSPTDMLKVNMSRRGGLELDLSWTLTTRPKSERVNACWSSTGSGGRPGMQMIENEMAGNLHRSTKYTLTLSTLDDNLLRLSKLNVYRSSSCDVYTSL